MQAVAEALPFLDGRIDFALMVAPLCFLDDVEVPFQEAHRVLRCGGSLVVGFIDPQSHLGQVYRRRKNESPFYREARFYSVQEVVSSMEKAGFREFASVQTIFHELSGLRKREPVRPGYGEGSFVVLRGDKVSGSVTVKATSAGMRLRQARLRLRELEPLPGASFLLAGIDPVG